MKNQEIHAYLSKTHRNIYQEAQLFHQNRKSVETYSDVLCHPLNSNLPLDFAGGQLQASNGEQFQINNEVIDFRQVFSKNGQEKWDDLNHTLVNYQKFLTPYVLLNSLPVYNYIGERTGLNKIKNAKVVDVGAGTGQIFGTFFYHQDSIDYFLLDPNLRLLHDQFLRLYPKLSEYPIAHLLCYAEHLPFKSEFADLVMSISSIDHFKDYKQFIIESHRILKPNGHILIASHLDSVSNITDQLRIPKELEITKHSRTFSHKLYNRLALKFEFYAKRFHNKKRGKVEDDHMHHFEDTSILEKCLKENGFVVELSEIFNHNFFIKARKI
jgi:ubiquinone/menaquinone biosynthesis C-methylase UbiE